jgi:hypothetical protein
MKSVSGNGISCRGFVWTSFAEPIWASGPAPRQQAGHMTAFEPALFFRELSSNVVDEVSQAAA